MAQAEYKSRPSGKAVTEFLESVEPEKRQRDAYRALEMMQRITGHEATMWGDTIVGFDEYHYKYDSGREATWWPSALAPANPAWCST